MSALFVMRRPGILVVSGTVREAGQDGVVIENTWKFPVSGREEKVRMHATFDPGAVRRMKISAGSRVIASTRDLFDVEMLMEGAEVPARDFYCQGYNIRYTGSFDFKAYGKEREQHVFFGTLVRVEPRPSSKYGTVRYGTVAWKKNGRTETRLVLFRGDAAPGLEKLQGKRAVVVTGASALMGGVTVFDGSAAYAA